MHVVGTIKVNKKGLPTSSIMKPSKTSGDRRGVMTTKLSKSISLHGVTTNPFTCWLLGGPEQRKFCAMGRIQREIVTDLVWIFQPLSLFVTPLL